MIYYIEDDEKIRELTLYALKKAGIKARGFYSWSDFSKALKEKTPKLVLLDIMLPEIDGLEILRRLKSDSGTANIPVMVLTAKNTEYDTVLGLDAGADDYLTKPFGMMELVSRINALLRRTSKNDSSVAGASDIKYGDIAISPSRHEVRINGEVLVLTLKEFELLRVLVQGAGSVLSRSKLLDLVWDLSYAGGTRTVDVHIQTLRQKMNKLSPGSDECIKTIRGCGYCVK